MTKEEEVLNPEVGPMDQVLLTGVHPVREVLDEKGDRYLRFSIRDSRDTYPSFQEILRLYSRLTGDSTPGKVQNSNPVIQMTVVSQLSFYTGVVESLELLEPHDDKPCIPSEDSTYFRVKLMDVESFYRSRLTSP